VYSDSLELVEAMILTNRRGLQKETSKTPNTADLTIIPVEKKSTGEFFSTLIK